MDLPRYVLIIEPAEQVVHPYAYFHRCEKLVRVSSPQQGIAELSQQPPDLLLLSASFSAEQCLAVLEAAKQAARHGLFPLIMVVNLSQPLSNIPGTTWGGKVGLLHTQSSDQEIDSTLRRVLQ